jgi:Thioesterase-like superfamily
VFVPEGKWVRATELARGPWDRDAQHGGAPAALLMRALERAADALAPPQPAGPGLRFARVTYELLRPVPIGRLRTEVQVLRPGRRVRLLETVLSLCDGAEVARARAVQVLGAQPSALDAAIDPPPLGPDRAVGGAIEAPYRPMFAPDALEVRFLSGGMGQGPATAWFRLRVPLVAGEAPSPLQRLAAAADFGNGISSSLSWDEHVFINPDLTLYVERYPEGEWIGLEARTRIPAGGIGVAESVLYDVRGRVGRALQALLVSGR